MPATDTPTSVAPAAGARRRFWPRFLLALSITLIILAAAGAWFTLREGRSLSRQQRAFGATVCACDLIGQWVERSGGSAWPASWADLESLPGRDYNSVAWPRDEAEIRQLVEVDFGATIPAVLAQRPDAFTAVRVRADGGVFNPTPIFRSLQERIAHATR
jgi:hypothetical protein